MGNGKTRTQIYENFWILPFQMSQRKVTDSWKELEKQEFLRCLVLDSTKVLVRKLRTNVEIGRQTWNMINKPQNPDL